MTVFKVFLLLFVAAQQAAPAIRAPVAGEILKGIVEIKGATDIPNFASAQLDFTYASSTAEAWFAIQTLPRPEVDATLAVWDTTLISDGDYKLRLRVFLNDGSFQDVIVEDLRVRNYTPEVLTPTPETAPAAESTLPFPTPMLPAVISASTLPPRFTPTPFPPNPASITLDEINSSIQRGILTIVGVFIVIGLFLRLRRS